MTKEEPFWKEGSGKFRPLVYAPTLPRTDKIDRLSLGSFLRDLEVELLR